MSPVTLIGNPDPTPDFRISGPFPPTDPSPLWNNFAQFQLGMVTGFLPRTTGNPTPRPVITNDAVTVPGTEVQVAYKGIQAKAISGGATGLVNQRIGVAQMMPITDQTGLAPGYVNPSWRRVHRFKWAFATSAAPTFGGTTGLMFGAFGGVQVGNLQWPTGGATMFAGGFGVLADGAGNWNWASFGAGPPPNPVVETVSLAAFVPAPEDWNTFEVVTISAAGDRAASLQLWVNDSMFLERDWVNAPVLFPLGPTPAAAPWVAVDAYRYLISVQAAPGGTLFFGDWTFSMGRFLPDGREALT